MSREPQRTALRVCTVAYLCSRVAAGHGGANGNVGDVPFGLLLFASAIGGLAGGIGLAWVGRRALSLSCNRASHLLVALIGATLLGSTLPSTTGAGGATVGVGLALLVWAARDRGERRVPVALTSIGVHRGMEGFALAAAYTTGTGIRIAGAVAVTAHAAVEIAAVYTEREYERRRELAFAAGIQSVLLITGAVGVMLGTTPEPVRSFVVSVVGGVLLLAGGRGVTAH